MRIILAIALFSVFSYEFPSCSKDVSEGEALAKQYCQSCHAFPEPALLPKNVWQYSTLPYMAVMLGVSKEIDQLQKPLSDYAIMRPKDQMIQDADWEKIKEYYLTDRGVELYPILYELQLWTIRNVDFNYSENTTKWKKFTETNTEQEVVKHYTDEYKKTRLEQFGF